MMRRRTFAGLLASAAAGALTGCGIRPQEQVEPSALRDPRAAELANVENAEAGRIGLTILGDPADATPLGFGFIPGTNQSYVAFEDGMARLFSASGNLTELEQLAPRLDDVFLAGPGRRRIIGFAHRGTSSSWNSANLSQQLVLRPQETTFSQARVLDAARVSDSPVLATATEGRRLELWSLVSGNLSRASQLPDEVAPRTIMPDSPRGAIVFGTETGEVRVWSGHRNTRLLYTHAARVLSISRVGTRGYLSTAQDGRAIYYSRANGLTTSEAEFDRAVYDSFVAPNGNLAVALPTRGQPVLFDTVNGITTQLSGPPRPRYSSGQFSSDGRFFAARHIDGFISLWDLARGTGRQLRPNRTGESFAERRRSDHALDFAYAAAHGLLLFANDTSIQAFDLETGRFMGTPLISATRIAGVETTRDGGTALVGLSDGRLIRFRPLRDIRTTVQIA